VSSWPGSWCAFDGDREPALQAGDLAPVGLARFALRATVEPPLLGHELPDPVDQAGDVTVGVTPLGQSAKARCWVPHFHFLENMTARWRPLL
jgi:hypothetical protein